MRKGEAKPGEDVVHDTHIARLHMVSVSDHTLAHQRMKADNALQQSVIAYSPRREATFMTGNPAPMPSSPCHRKAGGREILSRAEEYYVSTAKAVSDPGAVSLS